MTDAWRPWEPCRENVALASFYRLMDVHPQIQAYWHWVRNGAKQQPSEAERRGTEIHERVARRLRGHKADRIFVDECHSFTPRDANATDPPESQ